MLNRTIWLVVIGFIFVIGVQAQDKYQLLLKSGVYTPNPNNSITLSDTSKTPQRILVQFTKLPTVEEAKRFPEQGITILNSVANNALMLAVSGKFDKTTLPNIRWIGQIGSRDRLSEAAQFAMDERPDSYHTFVIIGFSDVKSKELETIITSAGGNHDSHPNFPQYICLAKGLPSVFKNLAKNNAISWIVPPSQAILKKQPVHYCRGARRPLGPAPNFEVQGVGWDGAGLGAAALSFVFENDTPDIGGTAEHDEVKNAFDEWAKFVQITFTEIATADQNDSIDVSWAAGAHGDGNDFDGAGGVLAHAFFPDDINAETIAGDMHFDEDETWSTNGDNVTTFDVFTVALHEIGHSLGLDHSADADAVMFAFIGNPVDGLATDDINGIRSLYATKQDVITEFDSSGGCSTVPFSNKVSIFGQLLPFALLAVFFLWRRRKLAVS